MTSSARARRDYIEEVLAQIAAEGPLSASEIGERGERRGSWWQRHDGKWAVEYLFWAGRVAALSRSNSFERAYAPPERGPPRPLLPPPTPPDPPPPPHPSPPPPPPPASPSASDLP